MCLGDQTDYQEKAEEYACEAVGDFREQILEELLEEGIAAFHLCDYEGGERYHNETHLNQDYSLLEAATLLEQLTIHKATDPELWEGLDPEAAISAQATYTFGNAVLSEFIDLIEKINAKAEEIIEEYDNEIMEIHSNIDDIETSAPPDEQPDPSELDALKSLIDDIKEQEKEELETLLNDAINGEL